MPQRWRRPRGNPGFTSLHCSWTGNGFNTLIVHLWELYTSRSLFFVRLILCVPKNNNNLCVPKHNFRIASRNDIILWKFKFQRMCTIKKQYFEAVCFTPRQSCLVWALLPYVRFRTLLADVLFRAPAAQEYKSCFTSTN
jgi:hypothetical protein